MTKTPEEEEKSLKTMRSVVINMGILLVIGTLALFVAIFIKAKSPSGEKKQISSINSNVSKCGQYNQADFPLAGKVISAENSNGILTVTTTKQVLVFDICKGKVLAKFHFSENG